MKKRFNIKKTQRVEDMAEAISKEFLEGNGNFNNGLTVDLGVLEDAKLYHATTEDLEKIAEVPVVAEEPKGQILGRNAWADMDVNLGEIAKNVFDTSERLIFIVSDDNVVYLNKKARSFLGVDDFQQSFDGRFFNFVDSQDWHLLADNIGVMLMEQKKVSIRLKTPKKIVPLVFSAVYLPDTSHFSFVLIGSLQQKAEKAVTNSLFDANTGLPNFFLFEDRLQMAINMEKDKPQSEMAKMAVVALSIDNIDAFEALQIEDVLYKKLAYQLALVLDKRCTVARGLKYPFWFLLSVGADEASLEDSVSKIREILDAGLSDDFNKYDLEYSLGIAVFPVSAPSAKKLVQLTIQAVEQAKQDGNNVVRL